MTSGLPSLLSDCGPDTPDSSIKEEPSEEASEVRIFNIFTIGVNYFSYHVRTRLIQCTNIACIWDAKLHLCKTVRGVKQMILIYNEKFTVQGTGVLACKWRNCGREFTEKKYLVDHVTSSHIEQRKGCDDFPCFWEVISLFLVNIVNLTLTRIKLPTILSVFFSISP